MTKSMIYYPSLASFQHHILGYSRGSVYGDVMQFYYHCQTTCLDQTLCPASSRGCTRVDKTRLGLERCDAVVRTTGSRRRRVAGFEHVVAVSYMGRFVHSTLLQFTQMYERAQAVCICVYRALIASWLNFSSEVAITFD